jgi:hypothetical protein
MLEFPDRGELSAWIENHSREIRTVNRNGRVLTYHVLDDEANPEMPVFFGFDVNRMEFYVSSSAPPSSLEELVVLEDTRIHFCEKKTYREAVEKMGCSKKKQRILATQLRAFLRALATPMEDTQNEHYKVKEDIEEALKLLQSILLRRKVA